MKVLYVHLGGQFIAGSERSLLDVLLAAGGAIRARVVCNSTVMAGAVREMGHDASVCEAMEEFSPWTTPPWRLSRCLAGVRAVLEAVRSFAPDVIHANTFWATQFAVPAGLLTRRKVVAHVRARTIRSGRELSLVRLADHVIAISRNVAGPIEALRGRRGRVSVVYDPIRVEPPLPPGAGSARPPPEPVRLAAAGRLSSEKAFDRCIRLLAFLRRQGLMAELTFYGEGEERAGLEKLAVELKVEGAVHFAGFVPDLARRLAGHDALLLSSLREGLGRVIAEAALVGVPALSVRVDGTGEAIESGRTGLLLDDFESPACRQAAADLLADREALARMGREAQAFCRQRFDPAAAAEHTLAVYRRLAPSAAG